LAQLEIIMSLLDSILIQKLREHQEEQTTDPQGLRRQLKEARSQVEHLTASLQESKRQAGISQESYLKVRDEMLYLREALHQVRSGGSPGDQGPYHYASEVAKVFKSPHFKSQVEVDRSAYEQTYVVSARVVVTDRELLSIQGPEQLHQVLVETVTESLTKALMHSWPQTPLKKRYPSWDFSDVSKL
jgi:hypothetical protein